MNRTPWMKTVVFVLAALWMLSGVAWADPVGPANVPQLLNPFSFGEGGQSRAFLTTEQFVIFATYYDPNAACAGVPPVLLQMLLFNLEGQLIFTCTTGSPTCNVGSSQLADGPKYRQITGVFFPGVVAAGAYDPYFLVRDCTNVNIVVLKAPTIRVLTP